MKFKLSWPFGIVIALLSFIIFILSYVYKATFMDAYDHHLVSENYYKDELNYQDEIDNENNGENLKENIVISKVDSGLQIVFPSQFDATTISGNIQFQRMSNNELDFKLPIKLNSNTIIIKKEILVPGRWNIKIDWQANKQHYLYKQNIFF